MEEERPIQDHARPLPTVSGSLLAARRRAGRDEAGPSHATHSRHLTQMATMAGDPRQLTARKATRIVSDEPADCGDARPDASGRPSPTTENRDRTVADADADGPDGGEADGGEATLADVDLVALHLAGDPSAFAKLVERYQRLVYKIAYSKANDREDAEDIAQEILLHAHRSLPKLRDPQAFLAWLMAIAHNRANRYCRTRQSKRRGLLEAQRRAHEENELERRRELRGDSSSEVTELVTSLDEEYRAALTWKYVEGLSYEEIGERLSMSFHQVDYLLRRAKRALRAGLERQRLEDPDA